MFGFINGLELQRIHPSDDTDICYKPYMDMELNGISREQILKRIKLFEILSKKPRISYKEYREICDFTYRKMACSRSTLSDFKIESKEYIKRITK